MDSKDLFNKTKNLKLPFGKYAIFGSGPLGVRNLRECHDIDIIVLEDVFNNYKNNPDWKLKSENIYEYLSNNGIELWNRWGPGEWDIEIIERYLANN